MASSRLLCCPSRSSKVLERLSELEQRQQRAEEELRACNEAQRRSDDQVRAAAEQVEAAGRAAEKATSLAEEVCRRVEQLEVARGEPSSAAPQPAFAAAEQVEALLARLAELERRVQEPPPPPSPPAAPPQQPEEHERLARELAAAARQSDEGIARAERRVEEVQGEMRRHMAATDQLLEEVGRRQAALAGPLEALEGLRSGAGRLGEELASLRTEVAEGRGSIAAELEQVSAQLSALDSRVESKTASRLLMQQALRNSRLAPKQRRTGLSPALLAELRAELQRALGEAAAAARCGQAARETADEGLALASAAVEQLEMLGLQPAPKGAAAGERRRTLEDRLQTLQREVHAMELGARTVFRQPLERKAAELRAELRCASEALQVRMDAMAEEFRAALGSFGADVARARSELQTASERSSGTAGQAAEALEATRWLKLLVAELEAGKVSRQQLEGVAADFRSDLAGCVGALHCELERASAAVHGVVGELSQRVDSQREAAFRMVDGRDIQRRQDQRELSDALDGLRLSCEQHEAELVGRIQSATSAQAVFASNVLPELKVVKDMKEHFYALEMSVAELKSKVLVVEAANAGGLAEKPLRP